jgi:hypothetical protein
VLDSGTRTRESDPAYYAIPPEPVQPREVRRSRTGMMTLMLALILQDADSIRDDIRAWLKADTLDAKEHVLRHGAHAGRVLWEERAGKSGAEFDRLTDLLFTLRFLDVRDEKVLRARDRLAGKLVRVEAGNLGDLATGVCAHLKFRAMYDTTDAALAIPGGTAGEPLLYLELDRALADRHLDWTVRYGVLLVTTPARLWPAVPAAPDENAAERARRLVEDLDAADVATREAASRELVRCGRDALPVLRDVSAPAEAKARAAEAIRRIEALHGEWVWTTTGALDKPPGLAAQLEAQMGSDMTFTRERLDASLGTIGRAAGFTVECAPVIADVKITLDAKYLRARDAILLAVCPLGLEIVVDGNRVRVDRKRSK